MNTELLDHILRPGEATALDEYEVARRRDFA